MRGGCIHPYRPRQCKTHATHGSVQLWLTSDCNEVSVVSPLGRYHCLECCVVDEDTCLRDRYGRIGRGTYICYVCKRESLLTIIGIHTYLKCNQANVIT